MISNMSGMYGYHTVIDASRVGVSVDGMHDRSLAQLDRFFDRHIIFIVSKIRPSLVEESKILWPYESRTP